ncbi:50S ribosomal protein L11 methyltransferase [Sphingomonas japonica]|uniref:Ribosomal protein L11 methyltransferase n=1 Tax=Sphingomonas japonica TaxID=511662 RepID=A0ABX0U409_9SPHN|nr:50S ribosomal protein L11 methyltransferase [Sphingomonas japonica]NIJ24116.1 ribosomal protein L11 methyltransferase [Sphingomonas japonica]
MTDSWKLTLRCNRAEAEALDTESAALAAIDPLPVLMTREGVEDDPDSWVLEAYFEDKPRAEAIRAVTSLVPSHVGKRPQPQRIADADWVTMSQAGIEPVHAGRFYVHTASNRGAVPQGAKAYRIEAGLAFGTGQHQTTTGCLLTLDAMKARGAVVRNLLDCGTGTGLLAFAAMHLWPQAFAAASDIDPVSIEVTRENAAANGVALGVNRGQLALAVAPGLDDAMLVGRAPYDLIIANILAGPLIALAPSIAAATAEGGTVILAGLLTTQADAVAAAYRRRGFRVAGRVTLGDWPTLRLVKRQRFAPLRASA